MSVTRDALREQIKALGDPLDNIRAGVEKYSDVYGDAPSGLPVTPSDEGRDAGTQAVVVTTATSPARTQPPTAEETASQTAPAQATSGPYRAFQTEAELDAWLAGEKTRLKEEWRRESNRDWDGQGNELKRLTTLARTQERDIGALQATIMQLQDQTIPQLTAQLAEVAATRGLSDGDIYRQMQHVNPSRMATENMQRGRQMLAEDDSRQSQQQQEQTRAAQALIDSRKEAGRFADEQKKAARDDLRSFALNAGVNLSANDAMAAIDAAYATSEAAKGYAIAWGQQVDNRTAADAFARSCWAEARKTAEEGIQAQALKKITDSRPTPTYDPPQAHGTAAGSTGTGDYKAFIKQKTGADRIASGFAALEATLGR